MADSYLETVAGQIADLALADQAASGDINIVEQIAAVMGASSQTLEEAYLTAVRVRRAEARARELLAQRKANNYSDLPTPAPAPLQYEDDDADAEEVATAQAEVEQSASEHAPETSEADDKPKVGMPRRVTR